MGRQEFKDNFQEKYRGDNGVIHTAGEMKLIQAIPTGIIEFDVESGIGGFPRGRIVEIFGPESGGKSLLSLAAIAFAQKLYNATALYFNLEGSTPREWMQTLGINLNDVDVIPSTLSAEQNFDTMVDAITSGGYTYIVVDSVPGLLPSAELEGDVDQNYMGTLARVMSKGLSKINNALANCDESTAPCIIFINQLREKLGVIMGNTETTPGGKALKFYSAQRYRVSKVSGSEKKEKGGAITGHEVKIKNEKNKLGPPKREGQMVLSYTKGIDPVPGIMTLLRTKGWYVKSGTGYKLTLPISHESIDFVSVGNITERVTFDLLFQRQVYQEIMLSVMGTPEDVGVSTDNSTLMRVDMPGENIDTVEADKIRAASVFPPVK